jgi:hypothetical protein
VLNQIALDPDVPILGKPFSIEALEQKVRDMLEYAPTHVPVPDAPQHRSGLLTSSNESQP